MPRRPVAAIAWSSVKQPHKDARDNGSPFHMASSTKSTFPRSNHPKTRDMQFLITDSESFFHEERRDLDNESECIEADALGDFAEAPSIRSLDFVKPHIPLLVAAIANRIHSPCIQ